MTLSDYLTRTGTTAAQFARSIGVNERETVRRYLNAGRVPTARIMRRISEVTAGQVAPNDWFASPIAAQAVVAHGFPSIGANGTGGVVVEVDSVSGSSHGRSV